MIRRLAALSLVALAGLSAGAQERVTVAARVVPSTARPGQEVVFEATVDIADGFHLYGALEQTGEPTRLLIEQAGGLRLVGSAEVPPGTAHETFGLTSHWIESRAVLRQRLLVPASASAGTVAVAARIDYMACTPEFCDPPARAHVEASLTIEAGAAQDPARPTGFDVSGLFGAGAEKHLQFDARVEPNPARPGETVDLILSVRLDDGWHVYGKADPNPITLVPGTTTLVPRGANRLPDGTRHEITEDFVNYWLEDGFELRQAFAVPADHAVGSAKIEAELAYLLCDDNGCLPEAREAVAVPLVVEAGAPRAEYLGGDLGERDGESSGLLALLLAAVAAGLFALLMPCTYPMIPITISFFTKQASEVGRSVLPLSLAYGGGIVLIFVLIGVVVGEAIVPFAAHWITNLVIAVAFLYFALALFGLVRLEPPQFLMNVAGRASTRSGYVGVLLMGACLVVTSFTCTVPFVGGLLGLAAQSGKLHVMIGMAAFGLTMALPFVLLSLLPSRMRGIPRAGEWMNTLKVFLGFVEIAAALKFASNVDVVLNDGPRWLSRGAFLVIWAVTFGVAGVYLLGWLSRPRPALSIKRAGGAILSIALAAYCGWGATGRPLDPVMTAIAPPSSLGGHVIVKDDFDRAVALALTQRKLVLVNFTGFT